MSYWESDPLIFALVAGGALVHVDDVPNGSACGCVCPYCKQPLVAKNAGDILIHHFAHQKGACKWAAEMAVTMLLREILERERRMHVVSAGYHDSNDNRVHRFSPDGWLDIKAVSTVALDELKTPAIALSCVDEHGVSFEILLVVVLAQRLTNEQVIRLRNDGRCVLSADFKEAYAGMRDVKGRHFSRHDFFLKAQDPEFLSAMLMGGDEWGAMRWLVHPERDNAAAAAEELYRKKREEERRAYEEERKARELEHQREMERIRLGKERLRAEMERRSAEAERMRAEKERARAEAERRRPELLERAIEAEKRAFADEGVEALLKVERGAKTYVDGCPLLGQADVDADCGGYLLSRDKCIFFEGQRTYVIGCTARQNGIGV